VDSIKLPVEIGSGAHPHGPNSDPGRVKEYKCLHYVIVSTFDHQTCWMKQEGEDRIEKYYYGIFGVDKWRKREYSTSMFVGHLANSCEEMFEKVMWLGSVVSGGKALQTPILSLKCVEI